MRGLYNNNFKDVQMTERNSLVVLGDRRQWPKVTAQNIQMGSEESDHCQNSYLVEYSVPNGL